MDAGGSLARQAVVIVFPSMPGSPRLRQKTHGEHPRKRVSNSPGSQENLEDGDLLLIIKA